MTLASPFKSAGSSSQDSHPAVEVSEVIILAVVQSFALVVTIFLVWVSIDLAEELRTGGMDESEVVTRAN